MHAKAIIIDDGAALVMSANLDRQGLDGGFELGSVIEGARAAALREILRGWAATAPWELRRAPLLGEVEGEAQVWVDRKLVPFPVTTSDAATLGNVVAASADHLESDPPLSRHKFGLPQAAHTLDVTWMVEAPRLAPKSKELDGKAARSSKAGDPPVFRESKGRLVVAVRTTDEVARPHGRSRRPALRAWHHSLPSSGNVHPQRVGDGPGRHRSGLRSGGGRGRGAKPFGKGPGY